MLNLDLKLTIFYFIYNPPIQQPILVVYALTCTKSSLGGHWILLEGNPCRTDFWKFNKLILKVQSYLSLASASSTVSASLEIILIQMKIEFLSRLWRIFVENILNVICLNDRMQ